MIHKIKYFESKQLAPRVLLQDIVNEFLSEKGKNSAMQSCVRSMV